MRCPDVGLKATLVPCYPGLDPRSYLLLWLGRHSHFERQAMVVKHLLCVLDCCMQGLGPRTLRKALQEGLK